MPRLVAVGSIAYDSLETPFGRRERALGGSAVHFSLAARLFTEVGVVGVVGDDFDGEPVLTERGIDTSGIQVVPGGTTFAWEGRYGYDLNVAETLDTRLGVFEHFDPQLGAAHRDAPVLFLGNIQPDLQRSVRAQSNAAFVALDSMNLWIEIAKDSLTAAIGEVDAVILNDGEARQLTGEATLLKAARAISALGPRIVVIKRGEYGAALFVDGGFFGGAGLPAGGGLRPHGCGGLLRRRLRRLPGRLGPDQPRPRAPAPRRRLRLDRRLLQRGGVRDGAGAAAVPRRGRRARPRLPRDDVVRPRLRRRSDPPGGRRLVACGP